jgi:hypothetical protein
MDADSQHQEDSNFENFPTIGGLMVSKMVVDETIKPRFMYREKRTQPEDSGWRIFTGFESEEYTDDPDNVGIYNPSTILRIDPSIQEILLKGVGSVYEKSEDDLEWIRVHDFEMEDDYMVIHRLTAEWTIKINNLFERRVEKDGTLLYTTGDKSVRISIWNSDESKEELFAKHLHDIKNRDQTIAQTQQQFDFSDTNVLRIGYMISENDDEKEYDVVYAFSFINNQVLQAALYFDEKEDLEWAIDTWKNIRVEK